MSVTITLTAAGEPGPPGKVLVTIHLPIDMGCAGRVMAAVAKTYPKAVVDKRKAGMVVVRLP